MAIKNLDSSLFEDKEPKKAKEGLKINLDNNKEEIYEELNKFMDNMPKDVMEQFNEMSRNLSSKLEGMDLGELFNIDIKKVEPRNQAVNDLFLTISRFDEANLVYDSEIETKIKELTTFLKEKYLEKKNSNPEAKPEEKVSLTKPENKTEPQSKPDFKETLKKITQNNDELFSLAVEKFKAEEFISMLGFKEEEDGFYLRDLTNLKFINPLTKAEIKVVDGYLYYGKEDKRVGNLLADRCLLYPDSTSKNYLILYAYKTNSKYEFYMPLRANYLLYEIAETDLKLAKLECFKYKTISSCAEHINTIFYLAKKVNFPLAQIGVLASETSYVTEDNLIYLGKLTFSTSEKASEFKKRFDVNENVIPVYLRFKASLNRELLNEVQTKIASSMNIIQSGFEVKYNTLKNCCYIEV